MKNATQCAKQLASLLKKLPSPQPELPDSDDPIAVLVMSFLMWESTTAKALRAYHNIFQHVVDYNDLRVCMPHEMAELIGARYPRGLDRCQRLRAALRDVYCREHAVSLDRLHTLSKREARAYLESLEGMVPYVAARIILLSFQGHAMPVDDQLRTQLIEQDAADTSAENEELASWLERQIKAVDGVAAHYALQAWVDGKSRRTARSRKKKATGRKKAASNNSAARPGASSRRKTKKKLNRA